MFCKKCGKELPDGSTFCSFCGTKVEEEKATPVQPQIIVNQPHYKVGLGLAIASIILCGLSMLFGLIPIVGIVFYYILMPVSIALSVPAFILSLIGVIKRHRLGASITSLCLSLGSVALNVLSILVIIQIIMELIEAI